MLKKIALFVVAAASFLSFIVPEAQAKPLSSQEIQRMMYELRDSEEFPYKARVKGTYVNMRDAPSTKGKKVGQISNGEVLVFGAELNDGENYPWYRCVNLKGGGEGWMFGQFVGTDWDEDYPRRLKHRFYALMDLEIPLDEQGRPIGWGQPVKTEKEYIGDFDMTYWTYSYDNAEFMICQSGANFSIQRASVSVPGRGFGGLYCGVDWCDQFYADKHLEGLLPEEAQRGEKDSVWHYDAVENEHFELFVSFNDSGLVKNIEYIAYID